MGHPVIPATVTIGAHTFEVRTDTETGKLLHDEGSRGDSRPDHHLIRLDTGRPRTAVAETLLHETLHCLWDQTALTVHEANEHQELVVTALAPGLLALLRANSDLVDYLTDPAGR